MPKNAKFHVRLRTVFVLAISWNSLVLCGIREISHVPTIQSAFPISTPFARVPSISSMPLHSFPLHGFLVQWNTQSSDRDVRFPTSLEQTPRWPPRQTIRAEVDSARFPRFGEAGPSKQLADWIAPTATIHMYRTCGHWTIMPRAPMCKLFTIYMDSIDLARSVLV